ncbi:hypothetical protein P7C71_g4934, partial [Lecanoromycetidae sp. Uapishka_2]
MMRTTPASKIRNIVVQKLNNQKMLGLSYAELTAELQWQMTELERCGCNDPEVMKIWEEKDRSRAPDDDMNDYYRVIMGEAEFSEAWEVELSKLYVGPRAGRRDGYGHSAAPQRRGYGGRAARGGFGSGMGAMGSRQRGNFDDFDPRDDQRGSGARGGRDAEYEEEDGFDELEYGGRGGGRDGARMGGGRSSGGRGEGRRERY